MSEPSDADHAMAWHQHGDAIEGAGAGHGARRFGNAHFSRQLAISAGLAARNLPERLPHAKLENRPAQIERCPASLRSPVSGPGPSRAGLCSLGAETFSSAASTSARARDRGAGRPAGNSSRRVVSASAFVFGQRQPAEAALGRAHNHPSKRRTGGRNSRCVRLCRPAQTAPASCPVASPS